MGLRNQISQGWPTEFCGILQDSVWNECFFLHFRSKEKGDHDMLTYTNSVLHSSTYWRPSNRVNVLQIMYHSYFTGFNFFNFILLGLNGSGPYWQCQYQSFLSLYYFLQFFPWLCIEHLSWAMQQNLKKLYLILDLFHLTNDFLSALAQNLYLAIHL